jgi:hypothetical protein
MIKKQLIRYAATALLWAACSTNHATQIEQIDQTTIAAALPSNGTSFRIGSSADGRYITFSSTATAYATNDNNGLEDVFFHDSQTNQTTLISRAPGGASGNSYSSSNGAISADGSLVVFYSNASDLVPGDTNGAEDIFLWTRATGVITRLAQPIAGESNGFSYFPQITPDGRYVVFNSTANNLVASDTNSVADTFRLDRNTGSIIRVSTGVGGTEQNGFSRGHTVSDDGDRIIFYSVANNLLAGDTNSAVDAYLKVISIDTLALVSRNLSGVSANSAVAVATFAPRINSVGSKAVFISSATLTATTTGGIAQVYVNDLSTATVSLVSVTSGGVAGNGACNDVSISPDGNTVYFSSFASNLVTGDTNSRRDIFARNLSTGVITRLNLRTNNSELDNDTYGVVPSADGQSVHFLSAANVVLGNTYAEGNFYLPYKRKLADGSISSAGLSSVGAVLAAAPNGEVRESHYHGASITSNEQLVAFTSRASNLVAGDTNNVDDVFIRNRQTQTTLRASVSNSGAQASCQSDNAMLTPDGAFLLATSCADLSSAGAGLGTYHVFRRTNATGQWQAITGSADGSIFYQPHFSDDGEIVAVFGATPASAFGQVFVRNVTAGGPLRLISKTPGGVAGNATSALPYVSGNGRYVLFVSTASDLVAGDTNATQDVFLFDLQTDAMERISINSSALQTTGARPAGISDDGRYVGFFSNNWLASGTAVGSAPYLFRKDRQTGAIDAVMQNADGTSYFTSAPFGNADISGDGSKVLFTSAGSQPALGINGSQGAAYIADMNTRLFSPLIRRAAGGFDDGNHTFPHFSPSGNSVVLFSNGSAYTPTDLNGPIRSAFVVTDWDRVFGGPGQGTFD